MKKVTTLLLGKEHIKEVKEEVIWGCTSWGDPKESGEYLVSDGNGKVRTLLYDFGKIIFDITVGICNENIYYAGSKEQLSNDDLIEVYRYGRMWYECIPNEDGDEYSYDTVVIYRRENAPKYYLKLNLTGPVDTEMETYEKIPE